MTLDFCISKQYLFGFYVLAKLIFVGCMAALHLHILRYIRTYTPGGLKIKDGLRSF